MKRLALAMMVHLACLGGILSVVLASQGEVKQATTAEEAVIVTVQKVVIEGGAAAPAKFVPVDVEFADKVYKGVRLTLEQRDKAYNAVRFPLDPSVDAKRYNTLKFKVHFATGDEKPIAMDVRAADAKGHWIGTSLTKHIKHISGGWYEFSWDMVSQPDVVRGMDMAQLARVNLHPSFEKLAKDSTLDVVVFDMRLVAGESVATGDPALFKKWEEFLAGYRPDYSNSSAMLLAPVVGRIGNPVSLVRGGQSDARIVVEADAGLPVQLAATELKTWIRRVTGANLTVTDEEAQTGHAAIYLGNSFARARYQADLKALDGTDGYAVRTNGSHVYIFGATDKGTLNGAFAFLENNTDLIWPRAKEELAAVYSQQADLDVLWADALVKPATRLRGWATNNGQRPEHEIWSVRNGNNYPTGGGTDKDGAARRKAQGGYVEFGGGHNLHAFIGAEQTEFYPEIDGQKPEKLNIWKHQLCFTHPDLPQVYTRNLLKYIQEKVPADADCVNVKIEDNRGVCTCARCMAPITLADGSVLENTNGAFHSTRYFQFLNQVVAGVRKEHPNLEIGTYAYFFTSTPPAVAVDENIRIYFCPYIRKDQRSPLCAPINEHWWTQLTQWAKKSPNVVIREYYGILNGFRPLAEVVSFDVSSYVDRGVMEYTAELNTDESFIDGEGVIRGGELESDFMAMEFWVINRLYWNPKQNVEQLRKYYIRRTFREGAPEMEKFFGVIRSAWYERNIPSDFEEISALANTLIIRPGREGELRQYLEGAAMAVKNPMAKLQVDAVREAFESAVTWAKDPAAKKKYSSGNPAVALTLGWTPSNEWKSTQPVWAQATVLSVGGKTVPAVRVSAREGAGVKGPVTLRNPWVKKLAWGDTIEMTMRPEVPGGQSALHGVKVSVWDLDNGQITAPVEVFSLTADGSVRMKWKLEQPKKTARMLNLDKLRGMQIEIPVTQGAGESVRRFYLTEMALVRGSDAGF